MDNIEYDIVGFKKNKCNFEIECDKYISHMDLLKKASWPYSDSSNVWV